MGVHQQVTRQVGLQLAPKVTELAPGLTPSFVRRGAATAPSTASVRCRPPRDAADKQLAEQHGNVDRAIHEVIENHVRYAGAQGFVTNLGGLVTAAVADPRQRHRAGPDPVPDDRRASRTCAATTSRTRGCATRSW